jgi:phenylalanyl-tRNA synthetase beta chain
MNVPYTWLLEYLQTDVPPERLAHMLTMAGLEVEAIEHVSGEPVLMTKITANRGDLLSMIGVAREAAANLATTYRRPEVAVQERGEPIGSWIAIRIDDPDLCPRYSARLIRGVRMGPSPKWLQDRLLSAGQRPINSVVDATNYVMWELGQPLHAFDYDLLHGRQIIVRTARPGETIVTIDGETRTLDERDLVIADADRAVAIAGVMGGQETEVHAGTQNVLLESAHFSPASIRLTAQRHGLSTEASYRFERVVDPSGTVVALERVAEIIADVAGGDVAPGVVDVYPRRYEPHRLTLRPARCNTILATQLTGEQMRDILRRLEFEVADTDPLQVVVPTFRLEVSREIDLIEEVARIYGYENIGQTLHPPRTLQAPRTRRQQIEMLARQIMLQCGLHEALNYSMIHPRDFDHMALPADHPLRHAIRLQNPATEEHQIMRTTLIPSLLGAVVVNVRRRVLDVGLFEINRVFVPRAGEALPAEPLRVGAVLTGEVLTSSWNLEPSRAQADFFGLKGIVEQLLRVLGVPEVTFRREQHPTFAPGRCAEACSGEHSLGILGEIAPEVQRAYDLPQRVYMCELDLEAIAELAQPIRPFAPLPTLPPVKRDLAVVVADDDDHSSAILVEAIRAVGGPLLREVRAFDVYRDLARIGAGRRSIAFNLEFRAEDRTLTDAEVDDLMARITAHLEAHLGARIRA